MKQLIRRCILWLTRRWYKTNRGKWHLAVHTYPLRGAFTPVCRPKSIWDIVVIKKHTPPKDGVVCKICTVFVNSKWY
jgi:hypothetical protein